MLKSNELLFKVYLGLMHNRSETEYTVATTSPPRRLLSIPPLPAKDLRARLCITDKMLPYMAPCLDAIDLLWADPSSTYVREARSRLRHRLSSHMKITTVDTAQVASAEQNEARVYRWWRSTLRGPLNVVDLQRFIAASTDGNGVLRTKPVWLRSQDGRTHLPMVAAKVAAQRLGELPAWLASGALGTGMLRAVRALALLVNAHPFKDGNGRLGRALFNFCLHNSGMPESCFVPLKSLSLFSEGGYEIRLREAELFGRWDGLLSYHCDAIDLCAWLSRVPTNHLAYREE